MTRSAFADDPRARVDSLEPADSSQKTVVNLRAPWYDLEAQAEALLLSPTAPATRPPTTGKVLAFTGATDWQQPQPTAAPVPPVDLRPSILPPQLPWYRRMWKGERLMHYNRLIVLVLAANAVAAYLGAAADWFAQDGASVALLADAVLINFAVAILVRQHYVINFLFWLATRAPTSVPLAIRSQLAKVYHFGGIHVGGAIAGTLWYLAMVVQLGRGVIGPGAVDPSIATLSVVGVQALLLVAICFVSRSSFRSAHHDAFEVIKRIGGWMSLALFWAQIILMAGDRLPAGESLFDAVTQAWQTWLLVAITFSVALPWLRLRRVAVDVQTPSGHVAVASFDYGVTPFPGSSTALSRSPLTQWHSFANIPAPGKTGYRLAISRAGDWTGSFIDERPRHVWVKGIPTAGVANIEVLFKRVVYVATGSGIGPCLPHLLANEVPARLVWATRDARKTFGDGLVEEILEKHPDAVIWDTSTHGKPDMVELAYRMVVEFDAEAVICISNKKLTWRVVHGMESRGIPAYGAIWDS